MTAGSLDRRAGFRLPREVAFGTLAGIAAIAAIAWVVTVNRMSGMDAGPGTDLGTVGWFFVVWVAMMAAMMLPSMAPAAISFAGVEAASRKRPFARTAVFVAGYLVPWALFGLLAYAVVEGVRSLDFAFLSWSDGGPYVAGGVIVAAALYELTPLKRTCLHHCRNPEFPTVDRPPGYAGALRSGIAHGGYCVGSSWGLMAALFAVGVMSIAWMVVVAVLIAADKLLPWGRLVTLGIVLVLAAMAVSVVF
jgi:predicted metal-binding membrane protein